MQATISPGGTHQRRDEAGVLAQEALSSKPKFDPSFTPAVIDAIGPRATPRVRQVMSSLIQHVHDFARDNEITVDEWMAAVGLVNEAGRLTTDRRNEGQLLCDVIGLESLLDEIAYQHLTDKSGNAPTASAIMGPFWRKNAPRRAMGSSIAHGAIDDRYRTCIFGRVLDNDTGQPIEGAELDVWHSARNGLYEQQDKQQAEMNLRGRFLTGPDGRYEIYCLRPSSYPIPYDGPAGKLLRLMDRHPMRPAHIHFIISAPRYRTLVTQLFDGEDEHLKDDAVFAVKESLIVDFVPRHHDPKAAFEVAYDFKIVRVTTE